MIVFVHQQWPRIRSILPCIRDSWISLGRTEAYVCKDCNL